VDIFYDHFLAVNWDDFSDVPLHTFVEAFHQILLHKFQILPSSVQSFVPLMIERKRLLSYGEMSGVKHALNIMSQSTSLPEKTDYAMDVLFKHYEDIGNNFFEFFPQLIEHVRKGFGIDFHYTLYSDR